mmetsp:Transcript_39193/g.117849  ORF Transcript_39193/g.117849 Transcript_39193/m.117849 type:complete len:82 (+) Transcript_39193:1485-1730(+)
MRYNRNHLRPHSLLVYCRSKELSVSAEVSREKKVLNQNVQLWFGQEAPQKSKLFSLVRSIEMGWCSISLQWLLNSEMISAK